MTGVMCADEREVKAKRFRSQYSKPESVKWMAMGCQVFICVTVTDSPVVGSLSFPSSTKIRNPHLRWRAHPSISSGNSNSAQ